MIPLCSLKDDGRKYDEEGSDFAGSASFNHGSSRW
jgi:hypothetical protein